MFATANQMMGSRNSPRSRGVVQNLIRREICGFKLSKRNPFGTEYPDRLRMSVEQIIPQYALEAGNVFMGFTACGRYLMSYTARPSENFGISWGELTFIYRLHFWLFCPYKPVRKVTSVLLFDNNGVCDNNLLIEISQWKTDDQKVLITGHSANPDGDPLHTQFFATIATIPPTQICADCRYVPDEEQDEDGSECFNILQPCLQHGLTMHLTFDHVSPFPEFNANTQLSSRNSVVFNTGNVIHTLSYKILPPCQTNMSTAGAGLSPRNDITPLLQQTPCLIPFLRCDLWFKSNVAMTTIISEGPIRDDTKYDTDRSKKSLDPQEEEINILSLNAQEAFLTTLVVNDEAVKAREVVELSTQMNKLHTLRRFSSQESITDISPAGFLNTSKSHPAFGLVPDSSKEKTIPAALPTSTKSGLRLPESPRKSKLMLPPQERKFFKRRISASSPSTSTSTSPIKPEVVSRFEPPKSSSGNSAYDVFDISGEETLPERSFSSFRKRRLADKKYEFSEADLSTENIIPLKLCRKRKLSRGNSAASFGSGSSNPLGSPRSPRYDVGVGSESPRHLYDSIGHPRSPRGNLYVMSPVMSPNSELDVLRPINNNLNNTMVKPPSFSPKDEPVDIELEKFLSEYYGSEHARSRSSTPKRTIPMDEKNCSKHPYARSAMSVTVNCIAKVLRSYIQRDDDNVSVITDIEDDCTVGHPFPVALPLDVHGMGYQQLNMISNAKAEKSPVPVVQILQRTLDIEVLCNEIAGIICHSAEKYYWSFCDYDAAIVDVCPDKGTVTAIVYVLVQAANLKGPGRCLEKNLPPQGCQDVPQKYEAVFSFAWEPSQEHCRILYMGDLREISVVKDPWNPTKHIGKLLKTSKRTHREDIKVLSNSLAVHDFLSVEELTDSMGMITIYFKDDPQKTERRSLFSNESSRSRLTAAAAASTTDDSSSSDDED